MKKYITLQIAASIIGKKVYYLNNCIKNNEIKTILAAHRIYISLEELKIFNKEKIAKKEREMKELLEAQKNIIKYENEKNN